MSSVYKKKIVAQVHFLLLLMSLFICRQFVSDALRIYELTANESELCIDISIEDSCSLETNTYGVEEAEEYLDTNAFNPAVTEFTNGKEAFSLTTRVHDVYLGLNTPPPEQNTLFV